MTIDDDPKINYAIRQVFGTYGDKVSVHAKGKTLNKFGRNPAINASTYETVWNTGGNETYPTTNAIDKISSSSGSDTNVVYLEGHTISGGNLTFVTQSKTLVGQTETALDTPMARCTRAYTLDDLVGTVYVYEDDTVTAGVPQTAANIHIEITEGNQSEKCATAISNTDYYFISQFLGNVFTKTGTPICEFIVEIRQVSASNDDFRRIFSVMGSNNSPTVINFDPYLIIPKNYDIRVSAVGSAAMDVGASFNGFLAKVQ